MDGATRVGRLAGIGRALAAGGTGHEPAELVLKRRVVPVAFLLLFLIVGAHVVGEQLGLYPHWIEVLLRLAVGAAAIAAAAAWTVRLMRAADAERADLSGRYQRLVEQLPLAVYVDELSERPSNVYTSPQIEPILGYSLDEWAKDPHLRGELLHPDDRRRVLGQLQEASASGAPFRSEYRVIDKAGQEVWLRDENVVVRDAAGAALYVQGYLQDVTDRKLAEQRLEELAYTDTLTWLANRERFLRELAAELEDGHEDVSILFLDLDDFKTVNDGLGHAAGDELLRAVGRRLAAAVRATDLVGRLGGDEFGILVHTTDEDRLAGLAERIRLALGSTATVAGTTVHVTASIGIACGSDSQDLLRDADAAMYAAKADGGDGARFFEQAMHDAVLARLETMGALQRPGILDELRLEYQPTFHLTTGRVVALEALVRWERPDRGLVPPESFMPLAEQTGAILGIGRWVLEEACGRVAGWNRSRDCEQPLALGVNVSRRQLASREIVADVASALARSGLPAELLTLELTETVLMTSEGAAAENLAELKRLGVRLAIDDFGTGYSSFSYLRRLPVDVIKLDRSFTAALESEPDRALVRGIVRLAHALGVELVAEGIEREIQINLLRELRFRQGQGFLLARPLRPEAVEPLLAAERPEALRLRVVGG